METSIRIANGDFCCFSKKTTLGVKKKKNFINSISNQYFICHLKSVLLILEKRVNCLLILFVFFFLIIILNSFNCVFI